MANITGFRTCGNKGFHIRFPNGLTLSTQFGGGNYCENYGAKIGDTSDHESANAEIAIFPTAGGEWKTEEIAKLAGLDDPGDGVIGRVSFDCWLKLFDACRSWRDVATK